MESVTRQEPNIVAIDMLMNDVNDTASRIVSNILFFEENDVILSEKMFYEHNISLCSSSYWVLLFYKEIGHEYVLHIVLLDKSKYPLWRDAIEVTKSYSKESPDFKFPLLFNYYVNNINLPITITEETDKKRVSLIVVEKYPKSGVEFVRYENDEGGSSFVVSLSNEVRDVDVFLGIDDKSVVYPSNPVARYVYTQFIHFYRIISEIARVRIPEIPSHFMSTPNVRLSKDRNDLLERLEGVLSKLPTLTHRREVRRGGDLSVLNESVTIDRYIKVSIGTGLSMARRLNTAVINVEVIRNVRVLSIVVKRDHILIFLESNNRIVDIVKFPPTRREDISDFVKVVVNEELKKLVEKYINNHNYNSELYELSLENSANSASESMQLPVMFVNDFVEFEYRDEEVAFAYTMDRVENVVRIEQRLPYYSIVVESTIDNKFTVYDAFYTYSDTNSAMKSWSILTTIVKHILTYLEKHEQLKYK